MTDNADKTKDPSRPDVEEELFETPDPNGTYSIQPPQDGTYAVIPNEAAAVAPHDGTYAVLPNEAAAVAPNDGTYAVLPNEVAKIPPLDATQTPRRKCKKRSKKPNDNQQQPQKITDWNRATSTPSRPYHDQLQTYDHDHDGSFMISGQGGLRPEDRQPIILDRTYNSNPGANQTYTQSPEQNNRTMSSGGWTEMNDYMQQNHPGELSSYVARRDYMQRNPGALGGPMPKPNNITYRPVASQRQNPAAPPVSDGSPAPPGNQEAQPQGFMTPSTSMPGPSQFGNNSYGAAEGPQPSSMFLAFPSSPQNLSSSGYSGVSQNSPQSMYSQQQSGVSPNDTFNMTSSSGSKFNDRPQEVYSGQPGEQFQVRPLTPGEYNNRSSNGSVSLNNLPPMTCMSGKVGNQANQRAPYQFISSFNGMDTFPSPDAIRRLNNIDPAIPNSYHGAYQTAGSSSMNSTGFASPPPGTLPISGDKMKTFNGLDARPFSNQRFNRTDPGMPMSGPYPGANGTYSSSIPESSAGVGNVAFMDTGSSLSQSGSQPPSPAQQSLYMRSFNGENAQPYPNQRLNRTEPGMPMSGSYPGANGTYSSSIPESSAGVGNLAFMDTGSSLSQSGSQPPSPAQQPLHMHSFNGMDARSYPNQRLNRTDPGMAYPRPNETYSSSIPESSAGVGNVAFMDTGSSFSQSGSQPPSPAQQPLNMSSFNGADPQPYPNQRFNRTDPVMPMSDSYPGANGTYSSSIPESSAGVGNLAFMDTGSSLSQSGSQPPSPAQQPQNMHSFNGMDARSYPNQRLNRIDPGMPMSGSYPGANGTYSSSIPESSAGVGNAAFMDTGSSLSQSGSQPPSPGQQPLNMRTFNGENAQPYPNQRWNRTEGAAPLFLPNGGNDTVNSSSYAQNATPVRPSSVPLRQPQAGVNYNRQNPNLNQPAGQGPIVGTWERDSSTPNRPYHDMYQNLDNDESYMVAAQGGLFREERQPIILDQTFNSSNPGAGQTYVQSPEPNYRTMSSAGWSEMDSYVRKKHPEEYSHYERNRDYMKSNPGMLGGPASKPNANAAPPIPNDQIQGPAANQVSTTSPNETPNPMKKYGGPNATFPPNSKGGNVPERGLMSQSLPNPGEPGFNPDSTGVASNASYAPGDTVNFQDLSNDIRLLRNRYQEPPQNASSNNSSSKPSTPGTNVTSDLESSTEYHQISFNTPRSGESQAGGPKSYTPNNSSSKPSTPGTNLTSEESSTEYYQMSFNTPRSGESPSGGPNSNLVSNGRDNRSSPGPGYEVVLPQTPNPGSDPNRSLRIAPYYGSPNGIGSRQNPDGSNMMAFNTGSPDGVYNLKVLCVWNRK